MKFIAAVLLLASTMAAQVTVTVGPPTAPIGSPVFITLANDSAATLVLGDICPYTVRDAAGNIVYQGGCPTFAAIYVPPGDTLQFLPWDPTGFGGNPVPPGLYSVEVDILGFPTFGPYFVSIGGADAAVATLGTIKVGTTRSLAFTSPLDPGTVYAGAAAFASSTGIPTCAGLFPLNNDALLSFSTQPSNGVFLDFVGVLNSVGLSTLPRIAVPNLPVLVGTTFDVAFVAVDFNPACPISRISAPTVITVF